MFFFCRRKARDYLPSFFFLYVLSLFIYYYYFSRDTRVFLAVFFFVFTSLITY